MAEERERREKLVKEARTLLNRGYDEAYVQNMLIQEGFSDYEAKRLLSSLPKRKNDEKSQSFQKSESDMYKYSSNNSFDLEDNSKAIIGGVILVIGIIVFLSNLDTHGHFSLLQALGFGAIGSGIRLIYKTFKAYD